MSNQETSHQKRNLDSPRAKAGLLAVVLVAVATYFLWPAPNSLARYRVQNILLSEGASEEKLAQLEPYVKLNDSFSSVAKRLVPEPDKVEEVTRATNWGLGLHGVNLHLLIRPDGRVAAIGRYLHGTRRDVEWFVQPGPDWTRKQAAKRQ